MSLAGTHHLTLSPPLLAKLATTPAAGWEEAADTATASTTTTTSPAVSNTNDSGAVVDVVADKPKLDLETILQDESLWRMAFTRAEGGEAERKLVQAINIFADVQDEMEGMVRRMGSAGAGV
jgi:hypothetical protein